MLSASRTTIPAILLAAMLLSGCQSPFLVFPGGELKGIPAEASDFSFADQFATLQLEVNPSDPYSVILRTTVIGGELYIDAAKARRWATYLADNREVRIKLGDRVYRAIASIVTEKTITDLFSAGRDVYRIDPIR